MDKQETEHLYPLQVECDTGHEGKIIEDGLVYQWGQLLSLYLTMDEFTVSSGFSVEKNEDSAFISGEASFPELFNEKMLYNTHAHKLSFFGTNRTHQKVTFVINDTELAEDTGAVLFGTKCREFDSMDRVYFGEVQKEEFTIEVTLQKSAMASLVSKVNAMNAPSINFSGYLTNAEGVYTTWTPDSFEGKVIKILYNKDDVSGENKLLEKISESGIGKTRFEDVSVTISSKVEPNQNHPGTLEDESADQDYVNASNTEHHNFMPELSDINPASVEPKKAGVKVSEAIRRGLLILNYLAIFSAVTFFALIFFGRKDGDSYALAGMIAFGLIALVIHRLINWVFQLNERD